MEFDFRTLGTPELEALARRMRDEVHNCHVQALRWRQRAEPYSEAVREIGGILMERLGRAEVETC